MFLQQIDISERKSKGEYVLNVVSQDYRRCLRLCTYCEYFCVQPAFPTSQWTSTTCLKCGPKCGIPQNVSNMYIRN